MGGVLALNHNAHRMQQVAELLLEAPRTMRELARGARVSVDDAEHVLERLRTRGLPVVVIEDLDPEPRYRILYPQGRTCAAAGCGTVLRRSNPSDTCEAHGGGVLDVLTTSRPTTTRGHREPVAFDGEALREARERKRLGLRRLAALAGVSPAYLSRLEHGTRRPTVDVADRLSAALADAPMYVDANWRTLRQRAGRSLRDVSRDTGINVSVLSRVERGERRATHDVAGRLARELNTPVMRR